LGGPILTSNSANDGCLAFFAVFAGDIRGPRGWLRPTGSEDKSFWYPSGKSSIGCQPLILSVLSLGGLPQSPCVRRGPSAFRRATARNVRGPFEKAAHELNVCRSFGPNQSFRTVPSVLFTSFST
jgi:hypothetical protein